jgi:hypothetical protein
MTNFFAPGAQSRPTALSVFACSARGGAHVGPELPCPVSEVGSARGDHTDAKGEPCEPEQSDAAVCV